MSLIFDTHAHYDDEAFDSDRNQLLCDLPRKNIFAVLNVSAGIKTSKKAVSLAEKYDYIYAAVGVHPQNINDNLPENYINELEKLILSSKKVVGVGEIGLDYHYNSENKAAQKSVFENQIQLAKNHNLPVMVHDWDAHADTLEILKKHRPKGVVHCFSGSLEMANEIIKLGMFIGVGGVVTFKNAKNLVNVVQNISLESILLETDAPYLAPVPFRGKRCDSSLIKFTAEKIAELRGISVDEVLEITKNNAVKFLNIAAGE